MNQPRTKYPYGYAAMIGVMVASIVASFVIALVRDFSSEEIDTRSSYDQVLEVTGRSNQPGATLGFLALTPSGNQVLIPYDEGSVFDRGSQPKHVLQRKIEGKPPIYKIID